MSLLLYIVLGIRIMCFVDFLPNEVRMWDAITNYMFKRLLFSTLRGCVDFLES